MQNQDELNSIWKIMYNNLLEEAELRLAIELWFGKFELRELSFEKASFAVDLETKINIIKQKYYNVLMDQFEKVIGFRPGEISIFVDESLRGEPPVGEGVISPLKIAKDNISEKNEDSPQEEKSFAESHAMGTSSGGKTGGEKKISLNTDYTFENFIVGSSNSFAHATALSVANEPGGEYNPFFLYGNSGLGKTHLMYAIANRALEKDPYMKVIYVKGEEFMNQLIESIRLNKNHEFREKYRKADMLLIDDIQFIAGKEATQAEFFHTFDALYEEHKQIIITSDRPPREIENLDERISSRFEMGLSADIKPPDFELRLAILKEKAKLNNMEIPPEVLSFLADKLNSNIRQIEGVVKKLGANHFLSGSPVTMDMVRDTVPEFLRENESTGEFVDKIISCVAERYHTTTDEILGPKRNKEIKNARNIAMLIVKELLNLSYPKVGSIFNRDYSTVHSNLSGLERQLVCDTMLKAEIEDIIKEIKKK